MLATAGREAALSKTARSPKGRDLEDGKDRDIIMHNCCCCCWKKARMSESHRKRAKRKDEVEEEDESDTNIERHNSSSSRNADKVCLRLISHSLSKYLWYDHNCNPRSRVKRRGSKKMLTTIIVLTALATCYGLALSASTGDGHSRDDGPDLIIANTAQVAGNKQRASSNIVAVGRRQEGTPTMPVEPIDDGGGGGGGGEHDDQDDEPPVKQQQQPQHRTTNTGIKNITAQNGQNVLLHCIVEPSGGSNDLAVSWFRGTGELQLLTYESKTIIEDDRFVVRHGLVRENDWALQIRNLDRNSDSGLYQCQTNSDPPQSQYYQLNVLEPQVHILGAPDMAVKLGSPINLSCVISQTSTEQPQFVFWFRDGKTINYELADRGKIVISKSPNRPDSFSSNLQIFHSKLQDSGNYTCMPSGARPLSIHVHVLEGLDNKRLIMFQNDDQQHILSSSSSAASSFQQTNSANALVRSFKTTEGRLYALVIAFSILANWTHLLAQVQTGITLLLLAIIGYLIGQVTDEQGHSRPGHQDDDELEPSKAVVILRDSKLLCSPPARKLSPNSTRSSSSFSNSKHGAAYENDDDDDEEEDIRSSGANTSDPLLEQANSALNLLKSLHGSSTNSNTSESDCAFERSYELSSMKKSSVSKKRNSSKSNNKNKSQGLTTKTNDNRRRLVAEEGKWNSKEESLKSKQNKEKKPLESPSAVSSSGSAASSASTGYNSDNTARASSLNAASTRQNSQLFGGYETPRQVGAGSNRATTKTSTRLAAEAAGLEGRSGSGEEQREQQDEVDTDDLYGDQDGDCSSSSAGGGPMIELVSHPTALSLVMDEFSSGRSSQITCSPLQQQQQLDKRNSEAERPSSSKIGLQMRSTKSSLSPPLSSCSYPASVTASASASPSSSSSSNGNDDEPHYSLPATGKSSQQQQQQHSLRPRSSGLNFSGPSL